MSRTTFQVSRKALLLFIVSLLALSLMASSVLAAGYISSPNSQVSIKGNRVSINVTYKEKVILTEAKLFRGGVEVALQTHHSMPTSFRCGEGKNTYIFDEAMRSEGNYSFFIRVADCVNNFREDSRSFSVTFVPPPGCGDKLLNSTGGEECDDGNTVDGDGCSSRCLKEACGNSRVDAGELCDNSDLNGLSCLSFGYEGGNLSCMRDCKKFDFQKCFGNATKKCGNGVIDLGEECDGSLWGPVTDCVSFDSSFTGGILECSSLTCRFLTNKCEGVEGGTCGDGQVAVGEECDSRARKQCSDFDNFFGSSIKCTAGCLYDTTACQKPPPKCGDGEVNLDAGETCDGTTFAGTMKSCADLTSYTGGVLRCDASCSIDTSTCGFANSLPETCFDGIRNETETDVDCGGVCACCQPLKKCVSNTDCCSLFCKGGSCAEPRCDDGVKNGLESDVDCGGECETRCAENARCDKGTDCVTNFCLNNVCIQPSCDDGVVNGKEADVDCGGECPSKCSLGQACEAAIDCDSAFCEYGICSVDKTLDSDGDGIPDWWEDKYGLDKWDASDANRDADDDGFSNFAEYENGTDPTVFDEGGKTHVWNVLLFLFGLLLMGGSTWFLVYYRKTYLPAQKASLKKGASVSGVAAGARSVVPPPPGVSGASGASGSPVSSQKQGVAVPPPAGSSLASARIPQSGSQQRSSAQAQASAKPTSALFEKLGALGKAKEEKPVSQGLKDLVAKRGVDARKSEKDKKQPSSKK